MAFRILCLSGGGFFGLSTTSVLAALEQKAGRPIAQCFDLMAGTSVGGIIVLGQALEKSATEIKATFETNGPSIFSSRPAAKSRLAKMADILRYLRPRNGIFVRHPAEAFDRSEQDFVGRRGDDCECHLFRDCLRLPKAGEGKWSAVRARNKIGLFGLRTGLLLQPFRISRK